MKPAVANNPENSRRGGSGIFFVIMAVIIVLIVAFLVLRPNPTGTSPRNGSTAPAPASSQ
ncbi:MAG: hypothetical protein M3Y50_04125 [Acidobacteriota bacterium]|nr:hypothetical protein [Acidobacteriota bacterium]